MTKNLFVLASVSLLAGCVTASDNYVAPSHCPKSNAIEQWKARAPQYSKTRIASEVLMGNPLARAMATGGTPQTIMKWDEQKHSVEVTFNELGNIVRVIDSATGCDIGPAEYAKRKVQ